MSRSRFAPYSAELVRPLLFRALSRYFLQAVTSSRQMRSGGEAAENIREDS
jgi:hypothetical protein